MQKKFLKKHLNKLSIFLLCTAVTLGAAAKGFGQNQTLADGTPPLTSQMIDRFAGLMQWALEVQFSPENRAALQKQIVGYWQTRDEKNIKGVLDTLAFEKNLAGAGEAKKQELQPQVKQKLLETMERERDDALNGLLLDIYNKNTPADNSNNLANGAGLRALAGKWQVRHGNSLVGVDLNSGRIGDGNAMIAEYDIRPDGRVIFSFALQQSNFGCTTRIKTSKTGRADVAGSRITFAYDGGTTTSEDNCNRKNNYTKKLEPEKETFDFRLGRNENGKPQFCFANATLKDCAVKVN